MWERLNAGKVKREKALSRKVLIGESWFDNAVHDPLRVFGVDLLLVTLLPNAHPSPGRSCHFSSLVLGQYSEAASLA